MREKLPESWWTRPSQELFGSWVLKVLLEQIPPGEGGREEDKGDSFYPAQWNKINLLITQIVLFLLYCKSHVITLWCPLAVT